MKNLLLTISNFRKSLSDSYFETAYNKLITENISTLSLDERLYLLKTGIILLNEADSSLERLGYRIILSYCNTFDSYIPLYDVSISKGYIPISKFIELNLLDSDKFGNRFFNTMLSSYKENFLQNGIYLSEG